MSIKDIDPSALVVSAVNFMFSSNELMLWKNSSLYCASRIRKVSSTNLFHRLGGCGAVSQASFSKILYRKVCHYGTEWTSLRENVSSFMTLQHSLHQCPFNLC